MFSLGHDVKSELASAFALTSTAATAGGSGDATEITGASIDVTAVSGRPSSVSFEIPCRAVLAQTKTLTVTGLIEYSANGSSWSTLVSSATLLTLTGATGGSTETGVARVGADLTKGAKYVRVKVTPDLSNTATDTAVIGAGVAVFGGLQELS